MSRMILKIVQCGGVEPPAGQCLGMDHADPRSADAVAGEHRQSVKRRIGADRQTVQPGVER